MKPAAILAAVVAVAVGVVATTNADSATPKPVTAVHLSARQLYNSPTCRSYNAFQDPPCTQVVGDPEEGYALAVIVDYVKWVAAVEYVTALEAERIRSYVAAVLAAQQQAELERIAGYVRSLPRPAPPPAPTPAPSAGASAPFAVDWARWQRLHDCEQPGNWYANGGNAADPAHQTFQGGLGMSTRAWQMAVAAAAARGVSLPSSALAASPEQQMIGAQAFYDAYGWGWSCHV